MELNGVVSHIENRALIPDEIALLATLITDEPDHYTVLGVNRNATSDEIQNAYCLAVEYFHPLKSRRITESDSVMHWRLSSAFLRIEKAYNVLSSSNRRRVYDDNLGSQSSTALRPGHRPLDSCRPQQDDRANTPTRRIETSKPRSKELRRVERVPLNLPVKVTFERHWQELAETLDVSPLGVRFRLSRQLEPGSELRLELPMPKSLRTHSFDDELYVVSAYVIYASNLESGRQVVAEFI
jgi:curved DNA-binding protein CbpA